MSAFQAEYAGSIPATRSDLLPVHEVHLKNTDNHISRGRAVWQLVGLITRRSLVQIQPPQQRIRGNSSVSAKG